MSHYLVLERLSVQNANCVAGLTYGFPAITHFLGYTHALSRVLSQRFGVTLSGCAVICHHHQVHAYRPGGRGDAVFALTKNPLKQDGSAPSFVEEGRMHMTISLIMHSSDPLGNVPEEQLQECVNRFVFRQKLAGGAVVEMKIASVVNVDTPADSCCVLRRLLPGFALVDRSSLLTEHFQRLQESDPAATMLNAWLDFASLTYGARANPASDEEALSEKKQASSASEDAGVSVEWEHVPKPAGGYLVPIMAGYRAVSAIYAPGKVAKSRDPSCPFRFVEPCYGVGQWLSPHRVSDLNDIIWRYEQQGPWYLCRTPGLNLNKIGLIPEQTALIKNTQPTTF